MSADDSSRSSRMDKFEECDCGFEKLREKDEWSYCPSCGTEIDDSVFEDEDQVGLIGVVVLAVLLIGGIWLLTKLQQMGIFAV